MLIIFDYFGVIAQDYFWYAAQDVAAGRHKLAEMRALSLAVNIGDLSWTEFCQNVATDIGETYEYVVQGYQDQRITPHIVQLLYEIKTAGHQLVLLSNASHGYLLPSMRKLGLDKFFDNIFVSSEMHLSKPDPQAFLFALNAMSVLPADSIMIDDNPANIEAAMALGVAGVLFVSADQCRRELTTLNVF